MDNYSTLNLLLSILGILIVVQLWTRMTGSPTTVWILYQQNKGKVHFVVFLNEKVALREKQKSYSKYELYEINIWRKKK